MKSHLRQKYSGAAAKTDSNIALIGLVSWIIAAVVLGYALRLHP